MQHLHEEDSSVEYFVSGAGHNTDPSRSHAVRISIGIFQCHYFLFCPYT